MMLSRNTFLIERADFMGPLDSVAERHEGGPSRKLVVKRVLRDERLFNRHKKEECGENEAGKNQLKLSERKEG